ncbi:MAG: winged helix-turn-helix transcriptional regulator [Candidatus Hodarchaeota archaeon]
MKFLDHKDLEIVKILDKMNQKVSTRELSKILGIPSRTIRYRLSKLKERGFLHPLQAMTHERKLGLGENIIVLQESPRLDLTLLNLFEQIPYFYWQTPTYGKFNGYLIHALYSTATVNPNIALLDEMQEENVISDYYIFDIVDYDVKAMNLNYFDLENGWSWEWEEWRSEIVKNYKENQGGILSHLETTPRVISFDTKDFLIWKNIQENASATLKQIGKKLDLSEVQVNRRIKRLERDGIIKGYKSIFTPIPTTDLLDFYLFIEFKESPEWVIYCLYQLPFTLDILMADKKKYCIRLSLTLDDFKNFLSSFDLFRSQFAQFFFQIIYQVKDSQLHKVYDLFNEDLNTWETPILDWKLFLSHLKDQ